MKTFDSEINICMITDKNYITAAAVAIHSMIVNKGSEKYNYFIITSNISEEQEKEFKKFEREDVSVTVIRENAEKRFNGLHNFSGNSTSTASIAALLKFIIPDLLPDIDKILYLDSDLIVEKDLGELYATELEENYAAVAEDSCMHCQRDEYTAAVTHYFNSGIMLLNLKKMRQNNISAVLIEAKRNIYDDTQVDQNILNMVFDGKVTRLPVRYNLSPYGIENTSINNINLKYGTQYETKSELFSDAVIIHFSSAVKPWNDPYSCFAYKWKHYYLSLNSDKNNEHKERYGISAVITCRNAEKQIESTVKSVLEQNFSDFEIIFIDYGSTDSTAEIIQKYTEKYSNITLYNFNESCEESARNFGIQKAQGKYVHLINCGDNLECGCWKKAYAIANENDTDVILFEAEAAQRKNNRIIKDICPKIYNGNDLFAQFLNAGTINFCAGMMLAKHEFLTDNNITFPETGNDADKYFIYKTVTMAKNAIVLPDAFYKTGMHESIYSSDIGEKEKIISLFNTIIELIGDFNSQEDISECNTVIFKYIQALCTELEKKYRDFEKKHGKEKCIEELGDIINAVDICMFIASSGAHSGLCRCTGEIYRELNAKLKQTYKEKSEISAKLQQTYREKSELNAKLKQTYKEKSEKTKQIKRLEKYSIYPLMKKIKKAFKSK